MSSKNTLANPKSQIFIRNATLNDVPAICDLSSRVYANTGMYGYSEGAITGQSAPQERQGLILSGPNGKSYPQFGQVLVPSGHSLLHAPHS